MLYNNHFKRNFYMLHSDQTVVVTELATFPDKETTTYYKVSF